MAYMVQNAFAGAVVMVLSIQLACAQFAPVAGLPGTTAIPADSSCFVEWANGCTIVRGPVNIADTSLGYASAGADSDALGMADDYVVSLGDGGMATVTFRYPLYNGPGFDFAVFENGFMTNDSNTALLELGFVEVSSDGVNFFRFPSISHVEDTVQTGTFGSTDGGQLYNLAGKYIARYGTPFDLEDLADTPGLDIDNIIFVRVIDVVGSINPMYARYDSQGHIINDPWPTAFASCGFDLDAVGAINAKIPSAVRQTANVPTTIFPNPVSRGNRLFVEISEPANNIAISDINGRQIDISNMVTFQVNASSYRLTINTASLSEGLYFISGTTATSHFNSKFVVE